MEISTLSSATSSPVARALDATERERLAQLEPIIERGMASFVEVGTALLEISDHRLYRETHSTFQEYVADRWQMTARRAYQLCTAAEVVKSLPVNNCSHSLITNEAQARELAKVEPEKRAKVLEVTAGKGEVTARSIQETAAQAATPFERNQCGDRFTPENSADGDGHRCPSCNKFGRFVPGPGAILELAGTINQIRYLALVAHAIQPGFCHVTVMSATLTMKIPAWVYWSLPRNQSAPMVWSTCWNISSALRQLSGGRRCKRKNTKVSRGSSTNWDTPVIRTT